MTYQLKKITAASLVGFACIFAAFAAVIA